MIRKQLNLQNTIKDRHSRIKELQSGLQKALSTLDESLIKFSINRLLYNKLLEIPTRHNKKFNNMIMEKQVQEGIHNNPNDLITNFTNVTLSNNEIKILKY